MAVALPYVTGILLGWLVLVPLFPLLGGALVFAAAALAWRRARRVLLYPLLFLTGWSNYVLHTAVVSPRDLRELLPNDAELVTVRGAVAETPTIRMYEEDEEPTWRTQTRVEVASLCINKQDWQPATGRIVVSTPVALTNIFARQTVEISGVAAWARQAVAEGTFDYRAYLKQQGIYYQLRTGSEQDWKVLASRSAPPLADRFCTWARSVLARGLPVEDESLRLEWALTLGWKPALTEEVSEPFVQAATYHIFAVDGLRMAIIFGIFFGLLRVFGLTRAVAGAVLLPVIWFYVALTGWPASAIRATVMLTVIIVGWILKRPSELINSLLAAAIIILVWEPQQLFQAGFQLSFFVVLCLILMLPPCWEAVRRLTAPDPYLPPQLQRQWPGSVRVPARYLSDLLLTSFAAWIGSIPLVAHYFNIITPVSTPANILAVPLCGLVLMSNLTALLLSGFLPAISELFNHAGWFLMECIRVSSEWFARWPNAYFYVPAPSLFTTLFYYGLLLAILSGWLFKPVLRPWKYGLLGILTAIWGWTVWDSRAIERLTILPVNGGTAIYFDAPGKRNDWLLDCGSTNSVRSVLKPFLRAQGVNRLPSLILSHGDLRHIGGAETLVPLFAVERVRASPARFRSPAYRKSLERFGRVPGFLEYVSRNDRLGRWTVLHPDKTDRFPRGDDNALVLAGLFSGARVLLLSDLGRAGQDALLSRCPDLHADIVIAGLPAQGEALCDPLLEAIRPRLVIISDSEFPAAERAGSALRERLAKARVPVLCTRFAGAATLEFRRSSWHLRTINGPSVESQD